MKKILYTGVLVMMSLFADAQTDELQQRIRDLMVLTGSAELGVQVCSQLINSYKEIYPQVPDEIWDEFLREINTNDLLDLIIPVYEKYFNLDEINELIQFYNTPVGKKTISVMPSITQDSMAAGQEWGSRIAEKIYNKLEKKGIVKL